MTGSTTIIDQSSGQPIVLPTHTAAISLPANTKYLSSNPMSRLLIREYMRTLLDLTHRLDVQTVVDLGCGEGLVLRQLSLLWRDKIVIHGVDISTKLLQVAQHIAPAVVYLAGSVYHLPLPDQYYDLVICTEVLEHLEIPDAALTEMLRIGKGYYLLSVPNEPWWRITNMIRASYLVNLGNTPGHINHWSRQKFIGFVNNYMNIVAVRQPFPWIIVLGIIRS